LGVLKRRPRYELPFENGNVIVKVIMKVYHDFRRTMVPPNGWRAFREYGLDFDTGNEPSQLLFEEKKLGGSVGFRELWSIYFPLDRLSNR
jgi:hypothetical protein